MKKVKRHPDGMRVDYGDLDWSKAVRGKYAKKYRESPPIAILDPDDAARVQTV